MAKKKTTKRTTKKAAARAAHGRQGRGNKPSAKKAAKKKVTKRKTRKKVGARSLISRDRIDKIKKLIKNGNYAVVAAKASGISESTFYSWKERGQVELERILVAEKKNDAPEAPLETERLYLEFLEEIELADAESETEAVKKVRSGFKDPDVAMRYLGLRFKRRWSRLQQHELSAPGGGPIGVITTEMSQEEASRLYLEKLKKDRD